jgi:membrane-bound lytic murein transglycosylase D
MLINVRSAATFDGVRSLMVAIAMAGLVGCATAVDRNGEPLMGEGTLPPARPDATRVFESEFGQIPIEVNQNVLRWIDYFEGRGRKHMEVYLSRSTRYMPMMKKILRENGLPEDLIYIALIESGFNARAHSHAAAVGYWQFIRSTGKSYGLTIDKYVDERRDPLLSTTAAAAYFRELYTLFDNWYLAMAAYNMGENGVKRAIMRNRTRDFWELARRRKIPRETINYVPKFLAAAIIAKDPKRFGFDDVEYQEPFDYEQVKVDRPLSLKKMAELTEVPLEDLKALNPIFRSDYLPVYKPGATYMRVPRGFVQRAVAALPDAPGVPPANISDGFFVHRVRRGDNLGSIARRYGTSVASLRRENRLGNRTLLRIGQRLRVPETARSYASFVPDETVDVKKVNPPNAGVATAVESRSPVQAEFHSVRRGENLTVIARRYGLSINDLRSWNGLGARTTLRVGQRLRVRQADLSRPTEGAPSDDSSAEDGSSTQQSGRVHRVQPGENLSLIAAKYRSDVQRLREMNRFSSDAVLRPGQKIMVSESSPTRRLHRVRRGETLTGIAAMYQVPMSKLVRKNNLEPQTRVLAGSTLVIP